MAAFTLPKPARLTQRAEFTKVREHGESWHGSYMVMGGWQSGSGEAARCGVITSRKVGGAVDRVRVRRKLREIFRLHRSLLPEGLWMVLVPRKAAASATYGSLADEWRTLASRAGYLES